MASGTETGGTGVPSGAERATQAARNAGDEARDVARQAAGEARDVKDTAIDHASQVGQEAKDKAGEVLDETRRRLRSETEDQGRRLAGVLHDTGRQIHSMAEASDEGALRDLTRQAGDAVERFAGRLDGGGVDGVLDDVRRFARRRPGSFLLGAGAAGFVLTRLLRASASDSRESAPRSSYHYQDRGNRIPRPGGPESVVASAYPVGAPTGYPDPNPHGGPR